MRSHPIQPSAQIFKFELDTDIENYEALLMREEEIDNKTASLAVNSSEIVQANIACEEQAIDDEDCPHFLEWGEWTECAGCGETALRGRVRLGCVANGTDVDLSVCELDTMTNSEEHSDCETEARECKDDGDRYNNDNALVFQLMQQQAEANRLDQQYSREMIQQLMMKMTENVQTSSMQQNELVKFFQSQNNEFQMMSMKRQNELIAQMNSGRSRGGCLSVTDAAISCETASFKLISLVDLKRNDQVLSYDVDTNEFACSRVVGQHVQKKELVHFYSLLLNSNADGEGMQVKLTAAHLIHVVKDGKIILKAAGDVKVGNVLRTKFGDYDIMKISSSLEFPVRY